MKKKILTLLVCILIVVFNSIVEGSDQAKFVKTFVPEDISGKVSPFAIEYTFVSSPEDGHWVNNPDSWTVLVEGKNIKVVRAGFNEMTKVAKLWGKWDVWEPTEVRFSGGPFLHVEAKESQEGAAKWRFGEEGVPLKTRVERLTEKKSNWAFDYDLTTSILEFCLPTSRSFWFRSIGLRASSKGTFATADSIRNGTKSSIGVSTELYYDCWLTYYAKASLGYGIETRQNFREGKAFEKMNQHWDLHAEVEIPCTNFPAYKAHIKNGYPRLAMPFTLFLDYLPEGKGRDGIRSPARIDFTTRYEYAPSPYFIFQWEYSRSWLTRHGFKDSMEYYSIAIGQDLSVINTVLPFIGLIMGEAVKAEGKNFFFYRYSSGRKPPNFQDLDQQSFGFSIYF